MKKVRCNNCMKTYTEDTENYEYIFECINCNTGDYLMDIKTK